MKQKIIYCCSECGNETINWAGKCPSCGAWNTLKEVKISNKNNKAINILNNIGIKPKKLEEIDTNEEIRFNTNIDELDRVLGGGAVEGSIVLVGGAPGIGKSTLLLQLCGQISNNKKVLYVSGEESENQIKLRASRLGVMHGDIFILPETNLDQILLCVDETEPDVLIIDSIQTIYDQNVESSPGSISQIRECTMSLMRKTKNGKFTTFIVGHINKDGNIAGPKILEHMVDCVLYFEGERNTSFRVLRAAKNRFGSTNEIGVFEMENQGLKCVENPSKILLSGRPENSSGTCVTCIMEGTRPILAEIQALLIPSGYNSASKRTNGIDYNRISMLLAVLEKRGGIHVSNYDVYVNVIGGLFIDDPAADLATVLAIASSVKDKVLDSDIVAIGEIGLSGEIRNISNPNQRIAEISRLGFKQCLIPAKMQIDLTDDKLENIKLIPVDNIYQALRIVL